MVKKTALPETPDSEPLPARITMVDRAFYEIGTSGVHRDLIPGTVVMDPEIIKEVLARGAAHF